MRPDGLPDDLPQVMPAVLRGGIPDGVPPEVTAAPGTPTAGLPALLDQAGAAVLVVDRETTEVAYANERAQAMAGRARLPLQVDQWGRLAGLADPTGRDLADSQGPLSLVCQGLPVAGVLIRRDPRMAASGAVDEQVRQASSSGSSVEDVHGPLWVTGFPLEDSTSLSGRALLVFLRLRAGVGSPRGAGEVGAGLLDSAAVRNRAVLAMDLAFTISDATTPDMPLAWVNPAFSRVTGYGFDEVVGRNCRFMQGPDTDPAAVDRIRQALRAGQPVVQTLLNHRKDGSPFWNEVAISPVLDGEGRLVNFVGIQSDVTARMVLEEERAEAYRLERRAREVAEHARAQTALLADVSHAMVRFDPREAMPDVAALLAGPWCAWAAVYLTVEGAGYSCVAVSGEGGAAPQLRDHTFTRSRSPLEGHPALTGDTATYLDQLPAGSAWASDAAGLVVAPLRVHQRVLGVLVLAAPAAVEAPAQAAGGDATGADGLADYLSLVDAVATRIALALDISRLYDRERDLARKLQRALLPTLPHVPGLELVGHYVPSTDAGRVGGDWYDVLPLPNGRVLVAIGDVEGHDVDAAAAMGQLRSSLQAYALEQHGPSALLGWLERALSAMPVDRLVTVCVALLDRPTAQGPGELTWAAAGHPPPLLRRADGSVEVLDAAQGPMLGARPGARAEGRSRFAAGDLLLLYTDGLIEDRRRSLSEGIELLAGQLGRIDVDDLAGVPGLLAEASPTVVEDDAAFLVVRALA